MRRVIHLLDPKTRTRAIVQRLPVPRYGERQYAVTIYAIGERASYAEVNRTVLKQTLKAGVRVSGRTFA